MPPKYLRGHRRSSPFRNLQIELVDDDDGFARLAGSPGVVLATDRPVEEYGFIGDRYTRFLLSLTMTKSMIGRWRADGLLNVDGSGIMLREHGGGWRTGIADVIGKWENLRVETRDDHKALVGDPAWDPALMGAWMARDGLEPDAWRGLVQRGMIAHTSVGFRVNREDMREIDSAGEMRSFVAPWRFVEASWVWKGQDTKAGMGREQEDTMDPEQLEALLEAASARGAAKGAEATLAAIRAAEKKETVLLPDVLELEAVERLDDDPTWRALQPVARDALGAKALDIVNEARAAGDNAQCITALQTAISDALRERTSGKASPPAPVPAPVPVPHRVSGGDVQAYGALTDLVTMFVGRGMRDVPDNEEERDKPGTLAHARQQAIDAAYKVDRNFRTFDPRRAFIDFARSMGIVDHNWYATDARQIMERIATGWTPTGQETIATMGGRWLAGQNAIETNGALDVLESVRHGAAGALVPADLQSVFLAIITKVFLTVHDSQTHMLESWGRSVPLSDLNAQTLIRHDLAIGFDEAVSNQDLPEAFLFDEAVDISTVPRGCTWSYGWESMFTDGGMVLAGTPALLAMRWMSCKIAHWFRRLVEGTYTSKNGTPINVYATYADQSYTQDDLRIFFKDMLNATGTKRPVKPPATMPKGPKLDVPMMGTMEPTALLYGNYADDTISNFFAPRQASRINNVSQDTRPTDFAARLGRNSQRTPYITGKEMYALITSGPATAMTSVGLAGQGMQVTSRADVNINQLPTNTVRIIDTFEAILTHPHGVYRNTLS